MIPDDAPVLMDGPVLVIGAAGVDIVGRVKGELKRDTSNPAQILSSFGGVARNVAENLSRLGEDVILLTAVGTDRVGDQMLDGLAAAGVDVGHVLRLPEQQTGSYLAVVNARGVLQYALDDMRIINAISSEFLHGKESLFEQASLVFIDTNLSKECLRTVFSLARRNNLPICGDPTATSLAMKLNPYLGRLFMITPNYIEAGMLCGRDLSPTRPEGALDAAKSLVNQGVEIAIITLAQFALCYASAETCGHVPAIETEVVDPIGAAEALTAAVIFGLMNEIPLDEAVQLGVSAAALTMSHPGSVLPDLSLQKLYDRLVN